MLITRLAILEVSHLHVPSLQLQLLHATKDSNRRTSLQEAVAALLWQWLPGWHQLLFVRTQVSTGA